MADDKYNLIDAIFEGIEKYENPTIANKSEKSTIPKKLTSARKKDIRYLKLMAAQDNATKDDILNNISYFLQKMKGGPFNRPGRHSGLRDKIENALTAKGLSLIEKSDLYMSDTQDKITWEKFKTENEDSMKLDETQFNGIITAKKRSLQEAHEMDSPDALQATTTATVAVSAIRDDRTQKRYATEIRRMRRLCDKIHNYLEKSIKQIDSKSYDTTDIKKLSTFLGKVRHKNFPLQDTSDVKSFLLCKLGGKNIDDEYLDPFSKTPTAIISSTIEALPEDIGVSAKSNDHFLDIYMNFVITNTGFETKAVSDAETLTSIAKSTK